MKAMDEGARDITIFLGLHLPCDAEARMRMRRVVTSDYQGEVICVP